jgi:hypothetical protein
MVFGQVQAATPFYGQLLFPPMASGTQVLSDDGQRGRGVIVGPSP